MKQNRCIGIFFVGFLFLSLSWSYDAQAMEVIEDASGDAFSVTKNIDEETGEITYNAVDAEGNVMEKLTEDELASLRSSEVADLKEFATKFGKTDKLLSEEDAKAFLNENKEMNQAITKLKNAKLSGLAESDLGKKIADNKTLEEAYQAKGAAKRTETAINKMIDKASSNAAQLSRDFKGDPNLEKLSKKYLRKFNDISAKSLSKIKNLVPDASLNFKSEMEAAVKSGNRKAVETLCVKISKLDAMSGLADQVSSLEKDAASGIAGFEGGLKDSLDSSLTNLNTSFESIEKDPESLLKEVDSGIKDAQGNMQKESMVQKLSQDLKTSVRDAAHEDILKITDEIDAKTEAVGEKLGTANKALSKVKGVFSGHALSDAYDSFKSTSITRDDITDGFCSAGRKLKSLGGKAVDLLEEGAKMLISGVMFMIPNIFQSAFLAQKQRQSELQTLANPIKFGNWVFQIPDSCFNFSNPSATLPIYVRIPVANVTDTVSSQMAEYFNNDVSGPTTANSISAAIHSVGATIASFAGNMTARPERYIMNESGYLAQNPGIVLAYFANNYPQWGSVPLTSSQFSSGQVIDLSGVIIDGSGNQINATGLNGYAAYPLVTPSDWHAQNAPQLTPDNMKDFCATMNSRMALSGDNVKYIEYSTVESGDAGATGSSGLQAAFDCSCLNPGSSQICETGSCAINSMVQAYASGCSCESSLLGSVIPLKGWGTTQGSTLINQIKFPGYSAASQATSFKVGKSGVESAEYANSKTNHALLGCWVYLSANTPFAKAVAGNSKAQLSVYDSYVDYIIFLNEQNEQVPLMVPVQVKYVVSDVTKASSTSVPEGYGTYTTLAQNPDIKYWTSLTSFDQSTNEPLAGFEDSQTGYAKKYSIDDMDASKYIADQTLAGQKGILASAIADLQQSFPNLAAQFATHQAAMQYKLENGPFSFGNVDLTLSDYNITVPGSSAGAAPQAIVPLYEGSSCFGSFEDDLLVALDANNNYVTLPDSSVAMFYSLITDVGYKVVGNSLVPFDFSQAVLLEQIPTTPVTYSLHKTLNTIGVYNVLDDLLESSLEGTYPLPSGTTSYISQALDSYVTAQRKAWIANFDSSGQKQGIKIATLTCRFPTEFKTKTAISQDAFVYEIMPNISESYCDHDLFVLTTSAHPSLQNVTSPINAENAEIASTYAISLITGFVFDMYGKQVMMNNDTIPLRVSVAAGSATTMSGSMNKVQSITGQIFAAINSKFDLATIANQNFVTKYHDWAQNYEEQMHRPMGPYTFGSLNIGIYAGDDAQGNYVYFPAQNMQNEDFAPSDVFVACTGTFPNLKMPVQFDDTTTYVLSLISGNLYDSNNNIVSRLPSEAVLQQTETLVEGWSTWLQNTVNDLQEAMTQRLASEQSEQQALNAILDSIKAPQYLLPSQVQQIIKELTPSGVQGLPAPYGLLKYNSNPIRQMYVHVSPLSDQESNGLLYFFFDIGTDQATGKRVGGVYTKSGQFVRLVKGMELEVMEKQFGVVVHVDGSQTLGIPLTQPFFAMKNPSVSLTLGKNSADGDLISSSSDQFPGGPISMAQGFYLYYSMSMKAYYIYDVGQSRWISSIGGHLYNKNGSSIKFAQKVAMLQSTKSKQKSKSVATTDDMILLYQNTHDADQGYMSDGQNYVNLDASSESMTWTSLTSGNELTVEKNSAGTSYTVVDDSGLSKVYKISSDMIWHSLFAVPIDEQGSIVSSGIPSSYRHTQLVMSSGKISHLLFHEVLYKVSSKKSNEYAMIPVNSTMNNQITLNVQQDEGTKADYVSIFDGVNTYQYMYIMDSLDESAQDFYRAKFAGTTSVATVGFPVGPVTSKTITIGSQNVTVSAPIESSHVLFVKDIANITSLTTVPMSAIQELPTGSELEILTAKFTGNVVTSKDGRFFVAIAAYDANNSQTFSYVSDGAYVDLYTGVLFDTTNGISLGYCLNLDDWLSVLNNVGVNVIQSSNNVEAKSKSAVKTLALRYRSSSAVNIQMAELVTDEQAQQNLKEFTASVSSLK